MKEFDPKPLIIAGPCAAETRKQVHDSAIEMKRLGITALRASLWKPRTKPSFEGVGRAGIPWLIEAMKLDLYAATEVMVPENAISLIEKMQETENPKLIAWLGSRNQNHMTQQSIARLLNQHAPDNTLLMIKNQPWKSSDHWIGIYEHVLSSGFPEDRILLCHRGFAGDNDTSFRNQPDFDMAMYVKERTGRPMIFDPSHVAGQHDLVTKATRQSLSYDFDGFIIEAHPSPELARSDKSQQLNFPELELLVDEISRPDY